MSWPTDPTHEGKQEGIHGRLSESDKKHKHGHHAMFAHSVQEHDEYRKHPFLFLLCHRQKTSLLTNNKRIVWLPTCHAHKRTDKQNQITILFHFHLALIIIQIPPCIIQLNNLLDVLMNIIQQGLREACPVYLNLRQSVLYLLQVFRRQREFGRSNVVVQIL